MSQSHSENSLHAAPVQNQYGEKFPTRGGYSTTTYVTGKERPSKARRPRNYSDSDRLLIHLPPERPDTEEEKPPETGLTLDVTVDGNDTLAKESNPSFCISASML